MASLTIDQFKQAIRGLILKIIAKTDEKATAQQAVIKDLSDRLTTVTAQFDALTANYSAEVAAAISAQLADLDKISTELAEEFNPTPGADAAVEVGQEEDAVEEIDVEAESPTEVDTIGTSEPTPLPVAEAAVDALVAVDEIVA